MAPACRRAWRPPPVHPLDSARGLPRAGFQRAGATRLRRSHHRSSRCWRRPSGWGWCGRGHEPPAATRAPSVRLPLLFEERGHIVLRRERDEIVDGLADTDVTDRKLEVVGDGYRNAAFR